MTVVIPCRAFTIALRKLRARARVYLLVEGLRKSAPYTSLNCAGHIFINSLPVRRSSCTIFHTEQFPKVFRVYALRLLLILKLVRYKNVLYVYKLFDALLHLSRVILSIYFWHTYNLHTSLSRVYTPSSFDNPTQTARVELYR